MTEQLKPVRCGCGGEAIVRYWATPKAPCIVRCVECGTMTDNFSTESEAIEAWNRAMGAKDINVPNKERIAKVETVEKPNVYKCSECGQYFHSTAWGSPVEYCSRCGCRLDWNEDIPMEYFENGGI